MSTYENLHGTRVNVVSTNPSNPKDGEVWYNSTLGQLKGYVLGTAAWSAGGAAPAEGAAPHAGLSGLCRLRAARREGVYPPGPALQRGRVRAVARALPRHRRRHLVGGGSVGALHPRLPFKHGGADDG